ncbi:MAG TPA: hypothetical protein PLA27_11170 [Anaerolineales bacterium]|mgnify:CR=1 FL=1|jgi:hypothetical protein|nr:hypothetical protein [Anaerolineales bacterium]
MKSLLGKIIQKPIYILLAVNLLIGVFVFRDYGLSWDEPLFYDYADALGYAYSPREWLSGHFDLENSYGPSAEDHKTRGPAYLFLARNFVYGLEDLGSDRASAWHLVNFLFFQLGVYFLYRLATRWMKPSAALAASAFFSYQPLLWGHAFINPKDPPFLVFFLASICLGFEMVDDIEANEKTNLWKIFSAAFCLGIATSIRVLGPLAGAIVLGYTGFIVIARRGLKSAAAPTKPAKADSPLLKSFLRPFAIYFVIAIAVMLITWPYLWENPITRLFGTLKFMSDNPTQLAVLFNGEIFRANDMPRRYLPFMLWSTLTEPTWFLFAAGVLIAFWKYKSKPKEFVALALTLSWFIILVAYVLILRPAVYDGLRHFLFILPPVFIFAGFVFEKVFEQFIGGVALPIWLRAGFVLLILFPGINGIIQLHPYEYAYYNSFVGGTSRVFRKYETEYWLTCYKEAMHKLDASLSKPAHVFVLREAYIAEYYSGSNTIVRDLRNEMSEVKSGDYVLVNTRANDDRSIFRDAPPVIQIRRGDAIFCEVKQIP